MRSRQLTDLSGRELNRLLGHYGRLQGHHRAGDQSPYTGVVDE